MEKLELLIKRVFDLIVSLVGVILISPIFLLIAIAIKIDSPGPIFFKQIRGGKDNKYFKIYKFRTMCDNAEQMGLGYKTNSSDPRITKIGNILRKTSLDELPQLINIIRGEMSIVGPRPALTVQTDNYDPYEKKRLNMKPGVTGYAQVNGRNSLSWDEKIELDRFYIDNFNLILDIKILFKTVGVVLKPYEIYTDSKKEKSEV
ncbi:sugar transferase [Paraclostridium sordellii]|uniref:sugar transferase n=1 Tax=Paraclostridium sordellii TaxID=1505 RepID=UPI0005E55FA8|nr:sugar transferase [Paeniclostridium sordellii]CEO26536.1 undecaprenyl phosphate galactosephosphotransferase [[Clostridium] sordellii] [Paeniclostridium sordellii]CEP47644.1 undecaprenyl phosphate galactosephosphotransferase [[Clostridium] sordellii] [Paeniclostridium sordellii]CEP91046.1 undecaprenyl phosphate galactosephosphotransferase [[Clostridium] sordellii] [Paeniclostridium sordellii]